MHNCFVSPTVSFLKSIIVSGAFWKHFSRMRTSGDGHCLVYSLMKSLKKQHDIDSNYHDVLDRIRHETNNHMLSYKQLLNIESDLIVQRLLCAYVDGKNFDTVFGDLLPMILSNIFNMNIVIINKVRNSIDPLIVIPRSPCDKFVYIYRSGDHYEGFETDCCFGSPALTLDTIECVRSKNTQQEFAQVETPGISRIASEGNSATRTCVSKNTARCKKPRITTWNIYGLTEYKLDVNEEFLRKSIVIIVLETWSRGNIAEDVFLGYRYFDFHRPHQHSNSIRGAGGIGVFIKEEFLDHITIYKNYKDIIVWIKFLNKYFSILQMIYC